MIIFYKYSPLCVFLSMKLREKWGWDESVKNRLLSFLIGEYY
jgi:hypothetical protein